MCLQKRNIFFSSYHKFIVLSVFFVFSKSYSEIIIPTNLSVAQRMLSDGSLDSTDWEKIEPFYYLPIYVPGGELYLLANSYPDLEKIIPKNTQLKNYEPWSDFDIIRFFYDYPQLLPFKPILNFSFIESAIKFHCVFEGQKSQKDQLVSNNLQLLAEPFTWIKFSGRIAFHETFVQWNNRTLKIPLSEDGSFSLGNFSETSENGLIYGYFNKNTKAESTSTFRNWLYGNGQNWNGIKINFASDTNNRNIKNKFQFFVHMLAYESIFGGNDEISLPCKLHLKLGFTSLKSDSISGKELYTFLGLAVKEKCFNLECLGAIDINNPTAPAAMISSEYFGNFQKNSITIIWYSKDADFSKGYLEHSIQKAVNSTTKDNPLYRVTLVSQTNGKGIRFNSELEMNFKCYILAQIDASLKLYRKTELYSWLLEMQCFPLSDNKKNPYTISIDINKFFSSRISTEFSTRADFNNQKYNASNCKMELHIVLLKVLSFQPYYELNSEAGMKNVVNHIGIQNRIIFFSKSESYVKLDCPIENKNRSGLYFECKASFTF